VKKIRSILALSLLMLASQAYANEKFEDFVPVAPVEAPATSSPKTEEKPEENVTPSASSEVEKPVEQPTQPSPSTNVSEEKPARSTYVAPAQTPPLVNDTTRRESEEVVSSNNVETAPSSNASSEASSSTTSSSSEKKEASVTKPDKSDTKEVKDEKKGEAEAVKNIDDKFENFEKGKVTVYDVMHVSFVTLLLLSFIVVAFIKRDKDGYKEV
jgi:hypothetical protein